MSRELVTSYKVHSDEGAHSVGDHIQVMVRGDELLLTIKGKPFYTERQHQMPDPIRGTYGVDTFETPLSIVAGGALEVELSTDGIVSIFKR